jgi:hypothetical protein
LIQAAINPHNFSVRISKQISLDQISSDNNIADFLIITKLLQRLGHNYQTLFFDFDDAHLITE